MSNQTNKNRQRIRIWGLESNDVYSIIDSVEAMSEVLTEAQRETQWYDMRTLLNKSNMTPYEIYMLGRTNQERTLENLKTLI